MLARAHCCCRPPPSEAWVLLFPALFLYWLGAWYLSQVLTFGDSRPERPWFPLLPAYWLGTQFSGGQEAIAELQRKLKDRPMDDLEGLDEDVATEMKSVCEGTSALSCPHQQVEHGGRGWPALTPPARHRRGNRAGRPCTA